MNNSNNNLQGIVVSSGGNNSRIEGQPIQRHSTLRRVREDLYSSIRTTLSGVGGSRDNNNGGGGALSAPSHPHMGGGVTPPPPSLLPQINPAGSSHPLQGGSVGGGAPPPSALAYHLANVLPPSLGGAGGINQNQGGGIMGSTSSSIGNSWVGASNWNSGAAPGSSLGDNIVNFQPVPISTSAVNNPSSGGQNMNPTPAHHLVMDVELGLPQMGESVGQPGGGNPGRQPSPPSNNPSGGGEGNQDAESGWSQILNSNPELKAVVNACERYIPFCILVFIKSVFEHGLGIIVCLGLVLTFLHSNSVVKHQIGRQARRNLGPLLAVTVNLTICTVFMYYMFFDDKLSLSAFFIPPEEVSSFVDLLWIVGINDFFLKFLSVFTKIIVTVLPAKFLPYQKRGKYYLFIEVTSQLHRQLAPIQPWLMYLLHAKGEGASSIPYKLLGVFLTAAYMVVKGKSFLKALELWRVALHKVLRSTRYGKSPTPDEMKSSNGFCPICQDSYQEPTMLHCKHIFCEECVATWFDRDTTCPMCRAKVSEDPSWRDGSTSQFIQLF